MSWRRSVSLACSAYDEVGSNAEYDVLRAGEPEDEDGLSKNREGQLGTGPYAADSDGDGVDDGADAYPVDPTRSQPPAADPNDHTPPVITLIYPSNARPAGGGQ